MTDTENHKGQWCKVDGRLCQEGWCDGCYVWETRIVPTREAKARSCLMAPQQGRNSC